MRFFLIDDDDVFNYLHESVIRLVQPDAEILTFKSGEEAIDFIKKSSSEFSPPDLIFLDIRMPDMDGFAFLEHLERDYKSLFSQTKLYMLSSTLDERDLNRAKSFELVTDFLGKPLTVELCKSLFSK